MVRGKVRGTYKMPSARPHVKSKSIGTSKKAKHKKKKRVGDKNRKKQTKTNVIFSDVMSSWAENFTAAATWQLKHQLAFWKARAISLEYENRVLCDVIRNNQIPGPSTRTDDNMVNNTDESSSESDTNYDQAQEFENTQSESDSEDNETDSQSEEKETGDNFEVSEEFIQFLTANAKYKEDAKRERELLKAKLEEEKCIEVEPTECLEQKIERSKELYGDKWQIIIALETNLKASFIDELDKHKPMYWPNIPLNFTTS